MHVIAAFLASISIGGITIITIEEGRGQSNRLYFLIVHVPTAFLASISIGGIAVTSIVAFAFCGEKLNSCMSTGVEGVT